jgi:hypothetical protein
MGLAGLWLFLIVVVTVSILLAVGSVIVADRVVDESTGK